MNNFESCPCQRLFASYFSLLHKDSKCRNGRKASITIKASKPPIFSLKGEKIGGFEHHSQYVVRAAKK